MDSIEATISQFYKTIEAKDPEKIRSFYVQDEDTYVVLEGPRFTTQGITKIYKGWKDFCHSSIEFDRIEWIEGPFTEETSEMAWISGIVDIFIKVNDKAFSNRFRASFVCTNKDGSWKIRHEHVSAPMEDPYGVGDWLKPDKS